MPPLISLTPAVIEGIKFLEDLGGDYEWAAELWGRNETDRILIDQILILKQRISRVSVNGELSADQRSAYRHMSQFYHHKRGRTENRQLVGWIHSHVYYQVFLSDTDKQQVRNYLREVDFLVSLVSARKYLIEGDDSLDTHKKSYYYVMGAWFSGYWNNNQFNYYRLHLGREVIAQDETIDNEVESIDSMKAQLYTDYVELCQKHLPVE